MKVILLQDHRRFSKADDDKCCSVMVKFQFQKVSENRGKFIENLRFFLKTPDYCVLERAKICLKKFWSYN